MTKNNIARLTYENYDFKTTWEMPYNDIPLEDIVGGFIAVLVGATWSQCDIIDAMGNYAKEHGYDYGC